MARSTNRSASSVRSEISDSLRKKAEELIEKNKSERAEAEANRREYEQALQSELARVEEEVRASMAGRKTSVNEKDQNARRKEAEKMLERVREEERKEMETFRKYDALSFKVNEKVKSASKNLQRATLTTLGVENLRDGKWKWNDNFVKKWTDKAPEEIKDLVKEYFKNQNNSADSERGKRINAKELVFDENLLFKSFAVNEKVKNFVYAYNFGKNYLIPEVTNQNIKDFPTEKEYSSGLKKMDKLEKFLIKAIKSTEQSDRFDDNAVPLRGSTVVGGNLTAVPRKRN